MKITVTGRSPEKLEPGCQVEQQLMLSVARTRPAELGQDMEDADYLNTSVQQWPGCETHQGEKQRYCICSCSCELQTRSGIPD